MIDANRIAHLLAGGASGLRGLPWWLGPGGVLVARAVGASVKRQPIAEAFSNSDVYLDALAHLVGWFAARSIAGAKAEPVGLLEAVTR